MGFSVGAKVVGVAVGCIDGDSVFTSVGEKDGCFDGRWEGELNGDGLGFTVGSEVVGATVRLIDGISVSSSVGGALGCMDGRGVGELDGNVL